MHTITLTFPDGADVAAIIDEVYAGLQEFENFEPNNTTVSFDTTTRVATFTIKGLQGLVSAVLSDWRFRVKVYYDPGNYLVRAITLDSDTSAVTGRFDGHPLIGWRTWEVFVSPNDPNVLRITTHAKERSRVLGVELGRALGGASAQMEVWDRYLENIAEYWRKRTGAVSSPVLATETSETPGG